MNASRGFTLVELLVAMVLINLILVATLSEVQIQSRTYIQESQMTSMEQNLRLATGMVADTLRVAGDGTPVTGLSAWIPWVAGFDANPKITTSGGLPATLSVARCSPQPVATLSGQAAAGVTVLSLASAVSGRTLDELLNTNRKRLVLIGNEHAHVIAVGGGSITIDSNPTLAGNQGLGRTYPAGAPLYRVDVSTFRVETNVTTGGSELRLDENQGAGADALALGISDLQIISVTPGKHYQISVTAESDRPSPMAGAILFRTLRADVTVRNAS
jgi:prepilin-type N-terminal cleavage/methylation domain-containing protein